MLHKTITHNKSRSNGTITINKRDNYNFNELEVIILTIPEYEQLKQHETSNNDILEYKHKIELLELELDNNKSRLQDKEHDVQELKETNNNLLSKIELLQNKLTTNEKFYYSRLTAINNQVNCILSELKSLSVFDYFFNKHKKMIHEFETQKHFDNITSSSNQDTLLHEK